MYPFIAQQTKPPSEMASYARSSANNERASRDLTHYTGQFDAYESPLHHILPRFTESSHRQRCTVIYVDKNVQISIRSPSQRRRIHEWERLRFEARRWGEKHSHREPTLLSGPQERASSYIRPITSPNTVVLPRATRTKQLRWADSRKEQNSRIAGRRQKHYGVFQITPRGDKAVALKSCLKRNQTNHRDREGYCDELSGFVSKLSINGE